MKAPNKVIDLDRWRTEARTALLSELFEQHQASLNAFLRVRLNSPDDAKDVLQDLFYRLARSEGLVEKMQNCDNPRAYLFSIANNLIVDRYRRAGVRAAYDAEIRGENSDAEDSRVLFHSPERDLVASRELAAAKQVILALPARCKTAFILNRFKHMSYKQVSDTMGVPVKRVEKYISKALLALRKSRALDASPRPRPDNKEVR